MDEKFGSMIFGGIIRKLCKIRSENSFPSVGFKLNSSVELDIRLEVDGRRVEGEKRVINWTHFSLLARAS